jgi:hypothetical protein
MNPTRLVSLGTNCISGVQIKFIRNQTGLVSPFTWSLCPVEKVLSIIKDDFNTILDKDEYVTTDGRPSWRDGINQVGGGGYSMPGSTCGIEFPHSNPAHNEDDYAKLKAQCTYIKECLSQPCDIGYMLTMFHNYESKRETLISIREIIPKDCKLLVSQVNIGENSEPELNDDNIYVTSLDIGDYTARLNGRKQPGLLRKGERARGYGISPEYTKIVDTVFFEEC